MFGTTLAIDVTTTEELFLITVVATRKIKRHEKRPVFARDLKMVQKISLYRGAHLAVSDSQ